MKNQTLVSISLLCFSFACGYFSNSSHTSVSSTAKKTNPIAAQDQGSREPASMSDAKENILAATRMGNDAVLAARPFRKLEESKYSFAVDCNDPRQDSLCMELMEFVFDSERDIALKQTRALCREKKNRYACSIATKSGEFEDRLAEADTLSESCRDKDNSDASYLCSTAAILYFEIGQTDRMMEVLEGSCAGGEKRSCLSYAFFSKEYSRSIAQLQSTFARFCINRVSTDIAFENFCRVFAKQDDFHWQLALDSASLDTFINSQGKPDFLTYRQMLFTEH